jgi:hypothetical protein
VQLDCRTIVGETCPGEERQAEFDGRRIQRIDSLVQLHVERFPGIEAARLADELLSEVCEDAPITPLARIGKRTAGDPAPDPHVVEALGDRSQAGGDVAQALSIRELSEGHYEELVPAGEAAKPSIPLVSLYAPGERLMRSKADDLREDGTSLVHHPLPCEVSQQNG